MIFSKKEACYICMNLSTYVKSGITLSKALELIKETTNDKKYKEAIGRIEDKVLRGENLSEAFKEEKELFPSLMIDMIKLGEESGNLEVVLEKCSKTLMAEKEIEDKVLKSIRYPVFLFIGLVMIIFFYGTYVLPQFVDMFDLKEKQDNFIMKILNNYINFIEENPNIEMIAFCYLVCFLLFIILVSKFLNY